LVSDERLAGGAAVCDEGGGRGVGRIDLLREFLGWHHNLALHETPELVLQQRSMSHADGARSIIDAIQCDSDRDEAAARCAAIVG
jgi:hypothetical protein